MKTEKKRLNEVAEVGSLQSVEIRMMRKLFSIAVAGLLMAFSALVARAQAAPFPNTVLVELFTSEGCSSCPPADALLKKIDGKGAVPGQTIIALSEHVTYWNHDGWIDPFSQEIFTERQTNYKERFKLGDVYTPQMIINGDQQVTGSKGPDIEKALELEAKVPDTTHLKIVSVSAVGTAVNVTFSLSGELPKKGLDIFVAVAENEVTSNVGKGENSGRTLTHVSVVRTLTKVITLKNADTRTARVPLGIGVPSAPRHLVVMAQTTGLGKVLSVATIPL